MKKLLLLLFITPIISFSQLTLNSEFSDVTFEKVYDVDKSKKELHQLAQEWIAINFKDSNEVIKLNTQNKIITKGNFSVNVVLSGYPFTHAVKFIMEIDFKEGKYKLNMNSFKLILESSEVQLAHHFNLLEYENFVNIYKKAKSEASKKYEIKYYNKILNNPKKLKELYITQKKGSEQFIETSNLNVRMISNSLFKYLSKVKSSDW